MIQKELIDKLYKNSILSAKEFDELLSQHDDEDSEYLFKLARNLREKPKKRLLRKRVLSKMQSRDFCVLKYIQKRKNTNLPKKFKY